MKRHHSNQRSQVYLFRSCVGRDECLSPYKIRVRRVWPVLITIITIHLRSSMVICRFTVKLTNFPVPQFHIVIFLLTHTWFMGINRRSIVIPTRIQIDTMAPRNCKSYLLASFWKNCLKKLDFDANSLCSGTIPNQKYL